MGEGSVETAPVVVDMGAAALVDVRVDEADERVFGLAKVSMADDRVDTAIAVLKEPLV